MHTEARTRPPFKLVLHDNEGPETINSAVGLRNYLLRNGPDGGGYQATFDDRNTVIVVGDDIVCYANGAINHESLDGCIVGYASQTAADWADLFDAGDGHGIPGAIEEAAQWFASKCRQYGIPPVLLTGAALHDPNAKGITTHGLLTYAGYAGTDGHSDPGSGFPIDKFILRVASILSPPINWKGIQDLINWQKRVSIRALRYKDRNNDVKILNDLLVSLGLLAKTGDYYGLRTWWAVAGFKKRRRFPKPRTGKIFGKRGAIAILQPGGTT